MMLRWWRKERAGCENKYMSVGTSPSEVSKCGLGMVLRFLVKQLINHLGKIQDPRCPPQIASLAAPFQIFV